MKTENRRCLIKGYSSVKMGDFSLGIVKSARRTMAVSSQGGRDCRADAGSAIVEGLTMLRSGIRGMNLCACFRIRGGAGEEKREQFHCTGRRGFTVLFHGNPRKLHLSGTL